jgi:hypothetical protein
MAKQWKVGTAYVEIQAKVKIVESLKKSQAGINRQSAKMGETAGQAFARAFEKAASTATANLKYQMRGAPGSGAPYSANGRNGPTASGGSGQQGNLRLPPEPRFKNVQWTPRTQAPPVRAQGLVPPSVNGFAGKLGDLVKQAPKAVQAGRGLGMITGSLGKLGVAGAAVGVALTAAIAAFKGVQYFAHQASPELAKTSERMNQLIKVSIGKNFVGLIAQWEAFKQRIYWSLRGKKKPFMVDIEAHPEFTDIGNAWKQLQISASKAQSEPLAATILAEQRDALNRLIQIASDINSKQGRNNSPLPEKVGRPNRP